MQSHSLHLIVVHIRCRINRIGGSRPNLTVVVHRLTLVQRSIIRVASKTVHLDLQNRNSMIEIDRKDRIDLLTTSAQAMMSNVHLDARMKAMKKAKLMNHLLNGKEDHIEVVIIKAEIAIEVTTNTTNLDLLSDVMKDLVIKADRLFQEGKRVVELFLVVLLKASMKVRSKLTRHHLVITRHRSQTIQKTILNQTEIEITIGIETETEIERGTETETAIVIAIVSVINEENGEKREKIEIAIENEEE